MLSSSVMPNFYTDLTRYIYLSHWVTSTRFNSFPSHILSGNLLCLLHEGIL